MELLIVGYIMFCAGIGLQNADDEKISGVFNRVGVFFVSTIFAPVILGAMIADYLDTNK